MKLNNKGFTMVEILAAVALIGILTSIAIFGVSRYKTKAINDDYEALAKSSYNAMQEYIMANPYEDKASIEKLEEQRFLSTRRDPASKEAVCEGSVVYEQKSGTSGSMDEGKYTVYLCCPSYKKKYTFPGGKVENITDDTYCTVSDDPDTPEPPTPPTPPPTPGAATIKVTFDCNGGSGGGSQTFTAGVTGQKFNKPCTKTGYDQDGWKRNKTGTASNYSTNSGVSDTWITNNKPSITLYAHWKIKSIKCNAGYYLKKSGLSCTKCTAGKYCSGGTYTYNTTKDQGINNCPSGYGNSAAGSDAASDCYMKVPANKYVKTAKASSSTACPSGQTKEAHNVYYGKTSSCISGYYITVTFNCNGGNISGGPASATYYSDRTGQKFSTTCKRTGYDHDGWNLPKNKNAAKADYTVTSGVSSSWITNNKPSITLYAHWKIKSIKCNAGTYLKLKATSCTKCTAGNYCPGGTFNFSESKNQGINACPSGYGNSAAGSSANTQCYMKVPANKYVKKAKDKTATSCATGTVSDAHNVYYNKTSSCAKPTCKITYSSNGGTFTKNATNITQTVKYGDNVTLKANSYFSPKKDWHHIDGNLVWKNGSTTYDTSKTYKAETLCSGLKTSNKEVTLNVNWQKNTLTIKYYSNGGELSPGNDQECAKAAGCTKSVCGKTVNGDNCTGKKDGHIYTSTPRDYDSKDWNKQGLRAYFSFHDATLYMTRKNYAATDYWLIGSATSKIKINEDSRFKTGKELAQAMGKEEQLKAGNLTVSIYAEWVHKAYTINYHLQRGTDPKNPSTYTAKTLPITLKNPSRTGYNFLGWNKLGSESKPNDNYIIKKGTTGDLEIVARWEINTYTCSAGKYLPKAVDGCATCTAGNYCPGGSFTYSTSKDQGINACPSGYGNSAAGSDAAGDCYMKVPKNNYIKTAKATSTTACASGYGKPAHNVYYGGTSSCIKKPTCTITATTNPYKGEWYKNNVTIKLNRSGGTATSYGLATTKNSTNKLTTTTISAEGSTTYYGYVSNDGGSATCSKTIKIDKSDPIIVSYKNNHPEGGAAKTLCTNQYKSLGINVNDKNLTIDGVWFLWRDLVSGTQAYPSCDSNFEWPSGFTNGVITENKSHGSGICRSNFPLNHTIDINELLCFRMYGTTKPKQFNIKYKVCDYVDHCATGTVTYKVGT